MANQPTKTVVTEDLKNNNNSNNKKNKKNNKKVTAGKYSS